MWAVGRTLYEPTVHQINGEFLYNRFSFAFDRPTIKSILNTIPQRFLIVICFQVGRKRTGRYSRPHKKLLNEFANLKWDRLNCTIIQSPLKFSNLPNCPQWADPTPVQWQTPQSKQDVVDNLMVDKLIGCSRKRINDVLRDWDQVMKNADKVAVEIGFRLFVDNPQCKEVFPTLEKVDDEHLITNPDFLLHSKAIIRGIDSCLKNLTAAYEEENEILPTISATHKKRGVTCTMMQELKQAVVEADTGNHFKNIFHVKKPTRRSSLAEVRETRATLTNSPRTSPLTLLRKQSISTKTVSPTLSDRRPSRAFLHPDHAKLMLKRPPLLTPPSERFSLSFEDSRSTQNSLQPSPLSSSAASSITSISNAPALESNYSDPLQNYDSRRSSTTTNKYSLLDAHDLEYALIKAAARGSIGPYSLSQSLQKLTFTQSLAFPELARGVSNKSDASQNNNRNKVNPLDSGVNAFAKVATALLLVLISVLVFGVLYKFIRT